MFQFQDTREKLSSEPNEEPADTLESKGLTTHPHTTAWRAPGTHLGLALPASDQEPHLKLAGGDQRLLDVAQAEFQLGRVNEMQDLAHGIVGHAVDQDFFLLHLLQPPSKHASAKGRKEMAGLHPIGRQAAEEGHPEAPTAPDQAWQLFWKHPSNVPQQPHVSLCGQDHV